MFDRTAFDRLAGHWVYGGTLAAFLLLAFAPLAGAGRPLAFWLAYLSLPTYMLHQYDEHDGDRFRRFVNALMGGEALSLVDVFWINILGVWVVLAVTIWLTAVAPGWALLAGWLLVVNGLAHLGQALATRQSNPGLVTALLLLLPLGLGALVVAWPQAGPLPLLLAPLLALAVHAAVLLRVRANLGRMRGE